MNTPASQPEWGYSVSVIIPTYNREHTILEAVESALGQGKSVVEVIVVDDGSTDETIQRLSRLDDPRLKVFQQKQRGPSVARNRGLKEATGDWIQFLDSDDALAEGVISDLVELARQEPGRIPFARVAIYAEDFNREAAFECSFATHGGDLLNPIVFYSQSTIFSCLLPRKFLLSKGGFITDKVRSYCEDFDLALTVALNFKFSYLPRISYLTRMHAGNRHREAQYEVWRACFYSVYHHTFGPRHYLLKRRAMAYYLGLLADENRMNVKSWQAIWQYLNCLVLWPVKKGAWIGLSRAVWDLF